MILYFSGTGNSRYCAAFLAHRLGDEMVDLFSYLKHGISVDLRSEKPWILVSPTYAWQLPHLLQNLLRTSHLSGSREIYFVMTCGSDIGNAPKKNTELCRELQLYDKGTLEVIMPENYIALFDAPQESEARAIIASAHPVLEEAADLIARNQRIPAHTKRWGDGLKSGPINAAFYPLVVRSKAFTVSDACIHCGKCQEHCVTNSIHLVDGKPVWGPGCTHCMACICGCPVSAIEYGKASPGKSRYQCPPYLS